MQPKHVVIVGGSVSGLAAGLALSQAGHRVTILEKDATPLPASPLEAFERWDRRGSPQTRHSHAFLARLRNLLRDRAPALLESLLAHGVGELRFTDMARQNFEDPVFQPEDEEITLLACRRITFEWVLRRHILDSGKVRFRDGVEVEGLLRNDTTAGETPHVVGVKLRGGGGAHETLDADLVLDASGRRSKLPRWLAEIGAGELSQQSEPCGIFYSSRFYRLLDADVPPNRNGVEGADLGYMKYGIFPGDAGIFSITLCASPDDAPMRAVLRTQGFEAAARALPATRDWVAPAISEPVTDVHTMGSLKNTRRFFVRDGEPLALGIQPIGDALIHTNPLNGRGCTLAFVNAYLVAELLERHPEDPRAFALELDAAVRREIVPWYEATRQQDRDAIEVSEAQQGGDDPFAFQRENGSVDPKAYMRSLLREGLLPGLSEDIRLLRAFMKIFNLLEAPQDLMARPELLQGVLAAWNRRHEREKKVQGPPRAQMAEILGEAA